MISFIASIVNELGEERIDFFLADYGLLCAWIIEVNVMDRKPSHYLLLDTHKLRNVEVRVCKDGYKETFVSNTFLQSRKL